VYEGGKPRLTGHFATPIRTRIFFGFWCGFILVWWVVASLIAVAGEPGIPLPIALLVPPAMIAFGVGITLFGQRQAAAVEQEINRVVQEAIEQRAA
jgi:apolipoprotein N-acyltransferase